MILTPTSVLFGRHEIDASRTHDPRDVPSEVMKARSALDALIPNLKDVLAWRYPREFDRDKLGERVLRWDVALFRSHEGSIRLELLELDGLGVHPIPVVRSKFVFEPSLGKADLVRLDPPPPLFEIHRLLDAKTPFPAPLGRGAYLAVHRVLDEHHVASWPESTSREGVLRILERGGVVVRHDRLVRHDEPDQAPLSWGEMAPEPPKSAKPAKPVIPPPPPRPAILDRLPVDEPSTTGADRKPLTPRPKRPEYGKKKPKSFADFQARRKAYYEWKKAEKAWIDENRLELEKDRLR